MRIVRTAEGYAIHITSIEALSLLTVERNVIRHEIDRELLCMVEEDFLKKVVQVDKKKRKNKR